MEDMEKDTKQCPFCGETIKALAKKCRFCGQWLMEIEAEKQPEVPKTKQCPYCGEEILFVAKKCKHCGEMLEEEAKHEVRHDAHNSATKHFDKDPIKEAPALPNGMMILNSILVWGLVQPLWFTYKYDFKKKETKKQIYEYLNEVAECGEYTIPQQIPLTFGIVNFVVFILTFTVNANWIWLFFLNALSLSIMEIRCAGTLERHVQRQYGVRLNINRFLLFFLQSLYLNYVLLTYEKRILNAKQYRR